jgi:hypothetical protein
MKYTFPEELAALRQWVCWRVEPDKNGRATKVPYNPLTGKKANSGNPATWASLAEALDAQGKFNYSGVGFVFTIESGIIGIDIDHCLDEDGQPNEIAAEILQHCPKTYVEISPSGTGLHIFLRGVMPVGGNRNSKTGVEMYNNARYFTMTGNVYPGAANVVAIDDDSLDFIHEKYIKTSRKSVSKSRNTATINLTDENLLELAQKSKDQERFGQLWRGAWNDAYPSQSEADYALCRKLAFWSGRDETQVDRLFRQSGLFRAKWDERHNASGESYGAQTVRQACAATEKCYIPKPKIEEDDTGIFEHDGSYYRKKGDRIHRLTNFIIEPVELLQSEDESQLTCRLVCKRESAVKKLLTTDFSNLKAFKNVINRGSISFSYFGSEAELELFKSFLSELDWPTKRGVKALGIYKQGKRLVFVTPQGAVGAGGKAVQDFLQMERYKGITTDLLKHKMIDREGMLRLGKLLMSYNEPAKTIPVLGWICGCFIKPHLKNCDIKFPHLFLIGEAGSGKSNTLERIVLPIFAKTGTIASSQITQFPLVQLGSSSNVIPMVFDEFKPSKIDRKSLANLYNHFRDAYDIHEGMRGKPDQTVTTYSLLAPVCVAGEESADETAIRARSIELLFSKKRFEGSGTASCIYYAVRQRQIAEFLRAQPARSSPAGQPERGAGLVR